MIVWCDCFVTAREKSKSLNVIQDRVGLYRKNIYLCVLKISMKDIKDIPSVVTQAKRHYFLFFG